jgi:uncharacterized membrane protein YqjE
MFEPLVYDDTRKKQVSNRIFDTPSVDKLSTLVAIARDNGLAMSIDFLGGCKDNLWIIQIFDSQERLVVSANAKTVIEAVSKIHTNWFVKTSPKT